MALLLPLKKGLKQRARTTSKIYEDDLVIEFVQCKIYEDDNYYTLVALFEASKFKKVVDQMHVYKSPGHNCDNLYPDIHNYKIKYMEMWNYIKEILFSKHKRVHVGKRYTSTLINKLKNK